VRLTEKLSEEPNRKRPMVNRMVTWLQYAYCPISRKQLEMLFTAVQA